MQSLKSIPHVFFLVVFIYYIEHGEEGSEIDSDAFFQQIIQQNTLFLLILLVDCLLCLFMLL